MSGQAPVSAVIPCYRNQDTIADAVASVAAQTLRPREVIVVDDGSGDGTVEFLHALAARYEPGWMKVHALARNAGPSKARNTGWEAAVQPYVAFLDADDTWHPEKIALQMQAIEADPELALVAHQADVRPRGSPPRALSGSRRARRIHRLELIRGNPFPTPTVLIRRDLPFRFDEQLRRVEDFLLWSQIVFSGYPTAKIPQPLASLHKPAYGAGGLSGDMLAMEKAGREVRNRLLRDGLVTYPEHLATRFVSIFRKAFRRARLKLRAMRG